MPFANATRRIIKPMPAQTKSSSGQTLTFQLPPANILARIWLIITGTVSGSLSNPNANGMASIVRRVRVTANSGQDLHNYSGFGYHYAIRQFSGLYRDPFPGSNARSAVTATTFDVSMLLDFQVNQRDEIGFIMLQNRQTVLNLTVDFEADATVATGATVAATVTPVLEMFTVPTDDKDLPNFGTVLMVLEDQQTVGGAMDYVYTWQRGGTYLSLHHLAGAAQSPADSWSRAQVRSNQAFTIADYTPAMLSAEWAYNHPGGMTRNLGHIPLDFIASSGLNMFGTARDLINSAALTNIETVITTTGALTLTSLRRQLVPLQQ